MIAADALTQLGRPAATPVCTTTRQGNANDTSDGSFGVVSTENFTKMLQEKQFFEAGRWEVGALCPRANTGIC